MKTLIIPTEYFLELAVATSVTNLPDSGWHQKTAEEIREDISALLKSALGTTVQGYELTFVPPEPVRLNLHVEISNRSPREAAKSRARAILGPKRGRWA